MAKNFLRRYKFQVLDDKSGESFGGFSAVSGINVGVRTTRYREGNDSDLYGQVIPGRPMIEPLVLSRGIIKDDSGAFYTRIKNAQDSTTDDAENSLSLGEYLLITVKGKTDSTFRTYKVSKPMVVNIKASDLDAMDSADDSIMVESITIEHTGIVLTEGR